MMFPSDYPMAPPFVRVTTPRFKFLTGNYLLFKVYNLRFAKKWSRYQSKIMNSRSYCVSIDYFAKIY